MAKRIVDEELRFSIIVNGNEAQKELYDLEKSTRDLTASNKVLKAERVKLFRQGKGGSAEYKRLTLEIDKQSATINKNTIKMSALQKQIGITGLTMSQLRSRGRLLQIQLNNLVPGSTKFKKLQAELQAVNTRMKQLRLNSGAASSGISNLANSFNKYAALGASVVAGLTGIIFTAQKLIDFNGKLADSMSDVQKTTGLTLLEVEDLSKSFGAFRTRTTRIELLKLAQEAGRLGIEGSQNIQKFVEQANKIKVALGDDLSDEAIRDVGKLVNIYNVGEATGKDFAGSMDALGSAINEVSASGANQAGYLVDYLKRMAGVASQAKISAADNIGFAATFDELGQSVEITATAMNKTLLDMFKDPAEYAKVAGVSLEDFTDLLNTDANAAIILFLEGLNGNSEGLSVMSKRLDDLGVDGARGAAALSALAGKTDLLKQRQLLANDAQTKAISLTDEYNIKNNNLAATLEKIQKWMRGAFASEAVTGGLSALVNGFARLVGITKDVNNEFENQSKITFEAAQNNRKLANESSNLLNRYEELTADGIEPTSEAKLELDGITLQLRDRLGESVMSIDAETGAFILNTEAVREQIKLKRLAADEEAATLASRLIGTIERQKELEKEKEATDKILAARKATFENSNKEALDDIRNSGAINAMEKQKMIESLEGYKQMDSALSQVKNVGAEIIEQKERELDLEEKLKDLNFDKADAVNLINPTTNTPTGPQEGDTKSVGTVNYVYQNGKWVRTGSSNTPTNTDTGTATAGTDIDFLKQNLDLKNQLIEDDFLRELAILKTNHTAKLTALQEQLVTEGKLTQEQLDNNALIREQMGLETDIYNLNVNTKTQEAIQADTATQQEAFEKELDTLQRHNALKLQAFEGTDDEKKALQETLNQQELQLQAEHLQEMIRQMEEVFSSQNFGGFDLNLLSDTQKEALFANLEDLKLKLKEVAAAKNAVTGDVAEGDDAFESAFAGSGNTDILGMSVSQWGQLYDNLGTTRGELEATIGVVSALSNAWGMYNSFVNQNEQVRLQNFQNSNRQQQEGLRNRLDAGLINQRQYDQGTKALQRDLEKRQAELEYNQAKRARQTAASSIITDTSRAIMGIWADFPKADFGATATIASIAVGALGATQLAMVLGTELPTRPGFEKGLYPIKREQDGKEFNVRYGGRSRSGIVNSPTEFIAGEGFRPEFIINGTDYSNFSPQFKQALNRQLAGVGVPGYEQGFYKNNAAQQPLSDNTAPSGQDTSKMIFLLAENVRLLKNLNENGVIAYMVRNLENAQKIKEDQEELQTTINKTRVS